MTRPKPARILALATLLFAAGFAAPSASAAGLDQFAGQWRCQYSVEPFNGSAVAKHYWEFAIMLQPNATYQMQGIYYNPVVGQVPVQGDGGWEVTQTQTVHVKGRILRQDTGWGPFEFLAQPVDARSLVLNFRGNTSTTRIVCER